MYVNLELSSNKKELLWSLLESSVIRIFMLEMTCINNRYSTTLLSLYTRACARTYINIHKYILTNTTLITIEKEIKYLGALQKQYFYQFLFLTYIWWYTSSVVIVIPVLCTYSVKLLNTQDLNAASNNVWEKHLQNISKNAASVYHFKLQKFTIPLQK